jgi:hypothetical protein
MIPNNPPPVNSTTDNTANNKKKSTTQTNNTHSAFNYKVNINDFQPQMFVFSDADINTSFNIHDRDTKKIHEDFNGHNQEFINYLLGCDNLNLFGNKFNNISNSIPKEFNKLFENIFTFRDIDIGNIYDINEVNTALETLELTNHNLDDLTEKHVNTAYHKLSKTYHPDRNPETPEKFIKITEAKEFLLEYLQQKK